MPTQTYLTIFFGAATLISLTVAVIQYKNASKVKKILDNYIKGLLEDSKKLTNIAQKQKNTELKTETDSLRQKMVTLDIVNRNLTKDKIEKLEKEEKLNKTEAEEYKKLTSE